MNEDSRILWLRTLGARIGQDVFLGPDVFIDHDFAPLLTIEDGVVIARGTSILLHDSALNNVIGAPLRFGHVILRERCYIGANSTILCGIEIGVQALVGACSLVTKSIPNHMVAYGHPAQLHGTVEELAAKESTRQDLDEHWHYLDMVPWRERKNDINAESEKIRHFINTISAKPFSSI